ncbi:hypothetical protein LX32DRAFT_299437 [Colletotrichum zoysiae]|uniref:Uncharacterized protein n=1 Tax=Colletotrichum zoysiae TaxID=1216348 RepID=A0AAD9M2S9_9PEZI|nr:hypothetical protein LX32DRAFT_299437 [Colletotrichum zoysiae]
MPLPSWQSGGTFAGGLLMTTTATGRRRVSREEPSPKSCSLPKLLQQISNNHMQDPIEAELIPPRFPLLLPLLLLFYILQQVTQSHSTPSNAWLAPATRLSPLFQKASPSLAFVSVDVARCSRQLSQSCRPPAKEVTP